jgi:hypothetical protein
MIAILTGCGGAPKSAGNNKWLNFGNGVINLSNVTNISFEDYAIKFDNFTLTLAQVEYTEEEKQQLAKASEANRIAESMHFNAENLKVSGGLDKKTENEVKEFVEKARKLNKKAEEMTLPRKTVRGSLKERERKWKQHKAGMRGATTASSRKTPWRWWRTAAKSKRWPGIWASRIGH